MRTKTKKYIGIGIITCVVIYFFSANPEYSPLSTEYEIVSVQPGTVEIKSKYSDYIMNVNDESLIQRCLDGTLKKGDTIKR